MASPFGEPRHMPDAPRGLHIQRYLASGLLTVIPLWVTWLLFSFVFEQLSSFGLPWLLAATRYLRMPALDAALASPATQQILAALLVLIALYALGWATNRVLGRRAIAIFESALARVPIVQSIYGAVRRFIAVLQQKPEGAQRVVLIAFPTPEMRTVGFVTRTLRDSDTGTLLAAVYVPTTPNPTSGYLEIVPADTLVPTDWTLDEAMNFVISGGAVAPDTIRYGIDPPAPRKPK
jgi:uncharacterized membrane protein